jgi:glyoxalase family protein
MSNPLLGIHHVTAIASDPQRNLDFYTKTLGLRLVKRTVNFDDPGTYHFYFGNGVGEPGTILTFFPWPGARFGRRGTGQATVTSFSIPQNSISYWMERFKSNGIAFENPVRRFDEEVLTFADRDGLKLELVAQAKNDQRKPWTQGGIPEQHAIRGFYGVTLSEEGYERTAQLLVETLGFKQATEVSNRFRYEVGMGGPGAIVDLFCAPDAPHGLLGTGIVHHVAWRVPDEAQQETLREKVANLGFNVTPVVNRYYFKSVYFREPGGVLFEIATDPPGFTVDEPLEQLGMSLRLPSWLEPRRPEIEQSLLPLRTDR